MRTRKGDSIPKKLKRLIMAAGLQDLDVEGKFVAIKAHMGEAGNVSFLKPVYARTIADTVTELGGKPFVTDCSTLYPGLRSNAVDHAHCAELNGFNSISCGCPVVIGDGLRGSDEVALPVPGQDSLLEEAYIGSAIVQADVLISLSHTKGCTAAAYGGAIKNLGMGCASRAGKAVQHAEGVPAVKPDDCVGCGTCIPACGQHAISLVNRKAYIDDSCLGCGHCIAYCHRFAIRPTFTNNYANLQLRMAEYAAALCASKPNQMLHIAIAIDVTPQCDCFGDNDAPIVPNIGMFASTDPVALDQAATDAICAAPQVESSVLPERHAAAPDGMNHLHAINPSSDWELQLAHAEELGAGTRDYELVEVR